MEIRVRAALLVLGDAPAGSPLRGNDTHGVTLMVQTTISVIAAKFLTSPWSLPPLLRCMGPQMALLPRTRTEEPTGNPGWRADIKRDPIMMILVSRDWQGLNACW